MLADQRYGVLGRRAISDNVPDPSILGLRRPQPKSVSRDPLLGKPANSVT